MTCSFHDLKKKIQKSATVKTEPFKLRLFANTAVYIGRQPTHKRELLVCSECISLSLCVLKLTLP